MGDVVRDLVIVGAGGHGRETLDIVDAINVEAPNSDSPRWNLVGFVDDEPFRAVRGRLPRGDYLGPVTSLKTVDADYVIAIGSPVARQRIDEQLQGWGRRSASLIHPLASVASDNRLGDGALLAAGARVTTNVDLGRHVHLNVNAVVSHDCVVGDYTTISPGAHLAGDVSVGSRSFLGIGAIVNRGVTIGANVMIGAGAVIVDDVPDGVTAKGVPGRW